MLHAFWTSAGTFRPLVLPASLSRHRAMRRFGSGSLAACSRRRSRASWAAFVFGYSPRSRKIVASSVWVPIALAAVISNWRGEISRRLGAQPLQPLTGERPGFHGHVALQRREHREVAVENSLRRLDRQLELLAVEVLGRLALEVLQHRLAAGT